MIKKALRTALLLMLSTAAAMPLAACNGDKTEIGQRPEDSENTDTPDDAEEPVTPENPDDKTMNTKIRLTVGSARFTAELADNDTAAAFAERLPLTLDMNELNRNEKYCNLDFRLPTDAYRPGKIEEGDLMLYGSDCVVIFYKTFSSSYSYTRIGKIVDTSGLQQALGTGSVKVKFELAD